MIDIKEYMNLSRLERTKHLDLVEPCLERGGNSTRFQGILADRLGTSFPERKKRGENGIFVHLCHACNNGLCSNYRHLYWGTPKENNQDSLNNGRKNVWDCTVEKYGFDKAMEMARERQKKVAFVGGAASANKTRKTASALACG
jgi:hypothetical protein